MMDVKPLHNERDYDWAIREVSRYLNSNPSPAVPMAIVSRFYPPSSRRTKTSTTRLNPKFPLAERPEHSYTAKIALMASFP